jgi:hypothetical protein
VAEEAVVGPGGEAAAGTKAAPERLPCGAWLRAAVWRPRRTSFTNRKSKVRDFNLKIANCPGFKRELLRFNRAS